MLSNKTQSGRSMVEVMGYMIVTIFLAVGISKIIAGAYGEWKISQAAMQVADLAKSIVMVSAADTDYKETIEAIQKGTSRIVPKSYQKLPCPDNNNCKLLNVFGGEVQVGTIDDKFTLTFTELDKEQCVALMTKEWENNRTVDLYSIALEPANISWYWPVYHPNNDANQKALPVKIADVAGTDSDDGACASENNSITWTFN